MHKIGIRSKNSVLRLALTFLSFIIQIIWILFLGSKLKNYSIIIGTGIDIVVILFVILVYNRQNWSASFKLPWIILILAFPFVGIVLYILSGTSLLTRKTREKYETATNAQLALLPHDSEIRDEVEKKDKIISNQMKYLSQTGGFPVFKNTQVHFFSEAENGFLSQLEDIGKAKKYIFLEYHAIEEDSVCFNQLKTLLRKKVEEGIEVRIIYDDVGSIGFSDLGFAKRMQKQGIQCRVFNPVSPILSLFMNNRDHRKITIIDGKIGYTGGYNIADEYFGYKTTYGEWKDTGIKLVGDAVCSLEAIFLEMWKTIGRETQKDKEPTYPIETDKVYLFDGYVQPYADMPLDNNYIGENVYMNLIKGARDFIYITTPYLIIGEEMKRELIQAAERGIDIRIVTPGILDKKIIYRITRSYYPELIRAGIQVYEYTPGFIHSKQFLVDNTVATVGTINMDFRSFYHHFENGVFMYEVDCISDISKDFTVLFEKSTNVTNKYKNKNVKVIDKFIRMFSSLL